MEGRIIQGIHGYIVFQSDTIQITQTSKVIAKLYQQQLGASESTFPIADVSRILYDSPKGLLKPGRLLFLLAGEELPKENAISRGLFQFISEHENELKQWLAALQEHMQSLGHAISIEGLPSNALEQVRVDQKKSYTTLESTKATDAAGCLGGGCFGVFTGIGTLGIGIILCFTGIGWLIGVPLILGSILHPLVFSAKFGAPTFGQRHGVCPYCSHKLTVPAGKPGLNCPACDKRILVRGNQLSKFE